MRFKIRPTHAGLSVFLSVAATALVAQPVPAPTGQTSLPAPEVRIHMDVVVTDKGGNAVSGLEQKDFALMDNKQPARIVSVRAMDASAGKAEPPTRLVLVIDAVNNGVTGVAREKEGIDNFLRANGGRLPLPVSIFAFTDAGLKVAANSTIDGNAAAAELDKSQQDRTSHIGAEGGNGAIERLNLSIQGLRAIAAVESKMPGRKLVIWVGGGWPMLTGPSFDISLKGQQELFDGLVGLSASLREARIFLYNVSIGLPGGSNFLYEGYLKGVKAARQISPGNLSVKVFAVRSGGRVLGPSNDLADQLSTAVRDAGSYYTLTFDPPRADGPNEYHDLKVEIGKPGLTARSSAGYYDQP